MSKRKRVLVGLWTVGLVSDAPVVAWAVEGRQRQGLDCLLANLLILCGFGWAAAEVAANKGYSRRIWFAVGFLLPCVGLGIAWVLPQRR